MREGTEALTKLLTFSSFPWELGNGGRKKIRFDSIHGANRFFFLPCASYEHTRGIKIIGKYGAKFISNFFKFL